MNSSKRKKIAFVIPSLNSGGAERVTATLANHFIDYYDVNIITISSNKEIHYVINPKIGIIDCSSAKKVSSNYFSAIRNNSKILKSLKKTLKSENIDLVISLTTTANILSSISCSRLEIPCIISERANPHVYTPNVFWRTLRKRAYPKTNYLIVQTQYIKEFHKHLFPKLHIEIIKNPVSNELAEKKSTDTERTNTILSVGRLDRNKAQDLLIKAFANINNSDWKLVFVGEGYKKDEYIALANTLQVEDKISFVGKSNAVHEYYNTSKIFAFTSQSEGFPNALLEAMYFQLACISTNCLTGPSELINTNDNGVLIPVNDQDALERELEHLINNPELQIKYGEEAYNSVKKYKSEIICEQWHNLVKSLIE